MKPVVCHEVAHWPGHDEAEVKDLGLSVSFKDIARDPLEGEAPLDNMDRIDHVNGRWVFLRLMISRIFPASWSTWNGFCISVSSLDTGSSFAWSSLYPDI